MPFEPSGTGVKRSSGTVFEASASAGPRLARQFVLSFLMKIVAVGLFDFLLLAVLAPNLVDLHQDLALAGAIICAAVALATSVWLAFRLLSDARRFSAAWRQLLVARRLEQDPP